jgi:hypothetical protein
MSQPSDEGYVGRRCWAEIEDFQAFRGGDGSRELVEPGRTSAYALIRMRPRFLLGSTRSAAEQILEKPLSHFAISGDEAAVQIFNAGP